MPVASVEKKTLESEDTMSILNRYIDESEFSLDKSTIKDIFKDLYHEACEIR